MDIKDYEDFQRVLKKLDGEGQEYFLFQVLKELEEIRHQLMKIKNSVAILEAKE